MTTTDRTVTENALRECAEQCIDPIYAHFEALDDAISELKCMEGFLSTLNEIRDRVQGGRDALTGALLNNVDNLDDVRVEIVRRTDAALSGLKELTDSIVTDENSS